ncbi:MAG: TlpA family protein disulfide reductase [Trueperaceae bacterium]|nr:TlpA family protein disulfide reductase [Trueperaceae bacterium]
MDTTRYPDTRTRRRRWALATALAAVALATAVPTPAVAQGVGAPLVDFSLRDQHGELVTRDDLLGRRWLLNVWASWCPPCRAELPLLQRVADELADDDVGLLLLNAGERASVASGFLEAEGLELRTLVDPDARERGLEGTEDVLRRMRARGLPTTFFVDADGAVVQAFVGELTPSALAELLETAFAVRWSP